MLSCDLCDEVARRALGCLRFDFERQTIVLPTAILAGGQATRLRPLTATVAKSLVRIAGEPFLAHQLRLLRGAGIERVVLCVGFLGDQIVEFAGDGSAFGLDVDYVWDGLSPLGTAGAIRKALPALGDRFFVMYGDSYLTCDYRAVQDAFVAGGADALMTVVRTDSGRDTSNVEYANGEIRAYDKRARTPRMQHIDYGLSVFHASVFADQARELPWDLGAVYEDLLRRGRLAGYEMPRRFHEIGSLEGIRDLDAYLSGNGRRSDT